MPPFIPLADGAQVELLYSLGGETIENRLWFISRQPPVDGVQLQALADGVAGWFIDWILPALSQDLLFGSVLARDWGGAAPGFPFLSIVNLPGGAAVQSQSASVAIRVRFKGSTAEHWRQNSNFVPGIPIDQIDGNYYSAAMRDVLFEGYVALIDAAASFGSFPAWRWVSTSRRIGNAWRTEQLFARVDFIQFPSPVVSPRRRRLPSPP